jgi:LuxR family transcriptional regulator, positive regulator of biofilm formation
MGQQMRIIFVLGSRVLSQGVRNIVGGLMPEAIFADQFSASEGFAPELVVFDSQENVVELRKLYSQARFVCLDMGLKDAEIACLVFCHGVNGIVAPQADSPMLCKALRAVHRGDYWIGQDYLKIAIENRSNISRQKYPLEFSEQDKRIVSLIVEGRKNSEIAEVLCLSESTIKAHVSRIYRSLQVKNRAQLTRLISRNHFSSPLLPPSE